MKDVFINIFRFVYFIFLTFIIFFEFTALISLLDYLGQYIYEYNAEMYLFLILGTALISILLNYLFVRIQRKNTDSELIYLIVMTVIYIIYTLLFLLFGVWLFRDYKYDYWVYWGTTIVNIFLILFYITCIRRNIKNR